MMLARVCRSGTSSVTLTGLLKTPVVSKPLIPKIQAVRLFANDGRGAFSRYTRTRSAAISEQLGRVKDPAFTLGRGAVACGCVLGIGSLCYYGLGFSSAPGAIEYAKYWPQYVKDRIRTTYMYVGASILSTVALSTLYLQSPAIMSKLLYTGWVPFMVSMVAVLGTSILVQSIPYKEGFGAKQMAWLLHIGSISAFLAPLYIIGGPLVFRAAWYTAGIVGGLSTVAICAPSEKFLMMGGPLAIGLGVVFASSVGSAFLPPTTALGSGLYSVALYGGLILFSVLLMHDTQKIIKRAETYPIYDERPYDPINNALCIYMDIVNIFIRIFTMLANGNSRKK